MLLGIFSILFYILFLRSIGANGDKDITRTVHLQSNTTSLELWIIFPVTFLFLLVWYKQKSDKNVKIFCSFLELHDFLVLKNKNPSEFSNDARTSTRSDIFASEFMYICDDFQFSVTRMNNTFYSVSKVE